MRHRTTAAFAILLAGLAAAHAEEGMWTFNNFPFDKVEKAYGFRPTQDWLDRLRLSSVRLAGRLGAPAADSELALSAPTAKYIKISS